MLDEAKSPVRPRADDDLDIRLPRRRKRGRRSERADYPLTAEERIRRRAEEKEQKNQFLRVWGNLGIGAVFVLGGAAAMLVAQNSFAIGLCLVAAGAVAVAIGVLNACGVRILNPGECDDKDDF